MNKIQKRRMQLTIFFIVGLFIALGLILFALRQNLNLFLTPTEIAKTPPLTQYHFRLGGLVKNNSIVRNKMNLEVKFIVTDFKHDILVTYNGVLPDLFKEGKGVIADGSLDQQGIFIATQVLAKHDENYVPQAILPLKKDS